MQTSDQTALRTVEEGSPSSNTPKHPEKAKEREYDLHPKDIKDYERKDYERLKDLEKQKEIEKYQDRKRSAQRKEDEDKKKRSTVATGRGRLFVGSSFYLTQAVQNSNSQLWNLKKHDN